jgi:hypothetical protein
MTACREFSDEYLTLRTLDVSDVKEAGVTFNCEINTLANLSEAGFFWSVSEDFSNPGKVTFTENVKAGVNSIPVDFRYIKGTVYYVKSYARFINAIVFGNVITFEGQYDPAVKINHFSPATGTWNDTISISGKNFQTGTSHIIKVNIGENLANIVSLDDTILKITVPCDLLSAASYITVFTSADTLVSKDQYILLPPEITGFLPEKGERGMELNIHGNNFCPAIQNNSLKIGEYNAVIKEARKDLIISVIPDQMTIDGYYDIIIKCGEQTAVSQKKYLNVESWQKFKEGQIYEPVDIFNVYNITEKKFMFGNKCYTARFNDFQRRLGKCNNLIYETDPVSNIQGEVIFYFLDYYQSDISLFIADNKIFIKRGGEIHLADCESDQLIPRASYPGTLGVKTFCFSIDENGYVYSSNNEFWEYEPVADRWKSLTAVSEGTPEKYFITGSKCYFIFKLQDNSFNFCSYYPPTDRWEVLNHYSAGSHDAVNIDYGSWLGYGPYGYCLTRDLNNYSSNQPLLYVFDPSGNEWIRRAGPYNSLEGNIELNFALDGMLYAFYRKSISKEISEFQIWGFSTSKF